MRITKAQLVHAVITMDKGEALYINAISLTPGAIDKLRQLIKAGVLVPVRDMVKRAYKDVEAVMSGDVIFPQMTYIKA